MSGRYGDGQYRAELYERDPASGDRRKRAEVANLSSLTCARQLNGMSQATLELPVPADQVEQGRLKDLHTIRYEVDAWRDEDMIWSGVLTQLEYGRTTVLVTAKDFLWWLGRRFIRDRVAYEDELGADGTQDVAFIASQVAHSALSVQDPALLQFLTLRLGGGAGQARYETVDRHTAQEAWDDLTGQGLDYTALGRLIFAAGGSVPVPDLPAMSDTDFLGEVKVIENGDEAATSAAVVGGGLVGTAGGVDAYYGLVERRFEAPATVTDQAVLNKMAADQVAARNPPPLLIQVPGDGGLAPGCQVPPTALVPGALGVISVGYVLRPVSQQLRLTQVQFEKRGVDTEQVTVQFQPVGPLADATT